MLTAEDVWLVHSPEIAVCQAQPCRAPASSQLLRNIEYRSWWAGLLCFNSHLVVQGCKQRELACWSCLEVRSVHGVMLALAKLGTHPSSQEKLSTSKCSFIARLVYPGTGSIHCRDDSSNAMPQSRSMGMEVVLYPAGALLSTLFRMRTANGARPS